MADNWPLAAFSWMVCKSPRCEAEDQDVVVVRREALVPISGESSAQDDVEVEQKAVRLREVTAFAPLADGDRGDDGEDCAEDDAQRGEEGAAACAGRGW